MSQPQQTNVSISSRSQRRRNAIQLSIQDTEEVRRIEEEKQQDIINTTELIQTLQVNWTDFWKRAKIYPDHRVEYADTSSHFSVRQRLQNGQRLRANAIVSDTEESDSEPGDENDENENTVVN